MVDEIGTTGKIGHLPAMTSCDLWMSVPSFSPGRAADPRPILMALGASLVAPLLLLTVTSATGLTLGTRSHLTSRRAALCGAGALVACRSAASAAPKKETLLERVARMDRESGQERNSQGSPEDRMPRLTVYGTQTKVTTSGLNCACEMTVPQRDISSEQVTAGEELPYVELL